MTYRVLFILFLTLVSRPAFATPGSVAGRVTAVDDTAGLAGVNVTVQGTLRGTTTNSTGGYRIDGIPSGTRTLVFSIIGYQRVIRSLEINGDGRETILDIMMIPAPVETGQIVITASKREQSLQDVPVSISVLDGSLIQQRNAISPEEALRYIPGVSLTGTQINIRGSSGYSLGAGSRVLMLLDGTPFIAGDTGELIYELIPMAAVDRIEVVKGASSALYGSNALGGVINIITKPAPEIAETIVRTYGGLYNKPDYEQWAWSDHPRFFNGQSLSHSQKTGDVGISLAASRQLDDGYRQNDYHRRYNVFAKVRNVLSPTTSVGLSFGLVYHAMGQFLYWRNADSALITPPKHETDNVKSLRYFLGASYVAALSDRALVTVRSSWSHNRWGFQQSADPGRTESLSEGFRLEVLSTFLPDDDHTATIGVDGNVDVIRGDMFGARTIGGLAVFAQDEARLWEGLSVTLGARCDLQSIGLSGKAGQFNPKAGAVYRFEGGTAVRASYGEGFRVPSLPEAFIQAGSTGLLAVPNVDLRPERSRSYEVGVSQPLGTWGALNGALFMTDVDDLIEAGLYVSGGGLQVQWRNVTRARIQGLESSFRGTLFGGGLECALGYTYVYPRDLSAHDILKYRPRHILTSSAQAQFGWIRAGVDFRYLSRVERIDDALVEAGVIPDGDQRVPIYVTDIRCGVEFPVEGTRYSMMLNVNNVFQHNYVELIGNVMPPRTFILVFQAAL